MGDLSEHFSESEFQCPCCGKVHVEPSLIDILEKIRTAYGKPLIITSGYRCKKHNAEVGGVEPSEHMGWAADVQAGFSGDRFLIVKAALALGVTRIGIGKTFVHIGVGSEFPQGVIWLYGE